MNFDRLYIVVATLFIILAVGFLCRKVKIIDDVASKKLSRLILTVGQPAMLISVNMARKSARSCFIIFLYLLFLVAFASISKSSKSVKHI